MIKLENTYTAGYQAAVRGMRFPMNSNHLADSDGDNIGPADLKLAKHLSVCGTDHGKYLRQICVWVDITAPLYWWKEMDTYKVGTVSNSSSTMHKLMAKEFELDDFSGDNIINNDVNNFAWELMTNVVEDLNVLRSSYLEASKYGDKELAKDYWRATIQLLPNSYNQKRSWTANYAVLRNIYHARKNHKLKEWHQFCEWIKTLPYSELITEE